MYMGLLELMFLHCEFMLMNSCLFTVHCGSECQHIEVPKQYFIIKNLFLFLVSSP